MYFYSTKGIILFFLLHSTEIFSTQEPSLENNISGYIDTWIISVLSITGKKALEIIRSSYRSGRRGQLVYNISDVHNQSHIRTFVFSDIYLSVQRKMNSYEEEDNEDNLELPEIQWNFPDNKLRLCFEDLPVTISASVTLHEDPKFYNGYDCDGYLENLTVTHHESHCDIKYSNFYVGHISELNHDQIPTIKEIQIRPVFPAMIVGDWEFIDFGDYEFLRVFNETAEEIISVHPDFLNNPQKYYYLIPEIPYFCFILKRVIIRGLLNFEFILNKARTWLLMRNIQGSVTLDYGFEEETDLELSFQIGELRLWYTNIERYFRASVYIEAKNYTVTRMKSNVQLSDCQSELIVDKLGWAFVSELFSSMEDTLTYHICDAKSPSEKIEIANGSDWKAIKESYKGRIPFNDV